MTDPRPLLGVSACLFQGDEVLLVRRGRPPFEGLLSLPGGTVRFGERVADAVRREVHEETGLLVDEVAFVRLHEAIDGAAGVHAVIAVFRNARDLSADLRPTAADDAAEALFAPVAEVAKLEACGETTPGLSSVVAAAYRGG